MEDKERQDAETRGHGDAGKWQDGNSPSPLTPLPRGGEGGRSGASINDANREEMKYVLTKEELKDPWKAMFSGGVVKMFEARKALTAQELGDAGAGGDEEVFRFVAECEKFGDAEAERRREERKDRRMNAEAI
ncbi:MAG TPA: hypothetical protein VGP72_32450, partial [Planctomycetota bacterium]